MNELRSCPVEMAWNPQKPAMTSLQGILRAKLFDAIVNTALEEVFRSPSSLDVWYQFQISGPDDAKQDA